MTATVTVNDIDTKVPSVTITTEDGQKVSFKVENPKNLEGVKAGDAMTRILRPAVLQPRLPLGASGTC